MEIIVPLEKDLNVVQWTFLFALGLPCQGTTESAALMSTTAKRHQLWGRMFEWVETYFLRALQTLSQVTSSPLAILSLNSSHETTNMDSPHRQGRTTSSWHAGQSPE